MSLVSKLLWGAGLENEVRIGFPLFDIITDREEEDGSQHVVTPGGTPISWITGRYYTIDAEVRWIPDGPGTAPVQTALSGAVGWQEFLDWARDAGVFRFQPDENVPDFYVDNVQLMEPRKGFGSLSPDIKRNVRLKLRNPTMDFHQALRGIMFEYAPGASLTDPVAATFARAVVAKRHGKDSLLYEDASGVLRDRHYESALRTTLLEGSRQNLLLRSEEFEHASWSATTVTVSANADVAPDGTTTADRLIEGALSQEHVKYQTLSGTTADVKHASSVFAKKGTRDFLVLTIRDLNSPTGQVMAWFNLSTGAVGTVSHSGVGSGESAYMEAFSNGWYRCTLVGACNAGDTTPVVTFGLSNANGTQIYTGDGVSYISLWGAQFENNVASSSSYIKTTSAAVTRNADAFSWPFTQKPQAMFVLVDFVEGEAPVFSDTRIVTISADNENGPRLIVYATSTTDTYTVRHEPVTGTQVNAGIDKNPVRGDRLVLLGVLNADGSVKIGATKNGDAEAFSSTSGTVALASAWTPILGIGSRAGSGSVAGFRAFARVKIGPLTFGGVTRSTIALAMSA